MSITWEYSVVAFIDVLGFSSFVEADSKSLAPTHLQRLYDALQQVKNAAPSNNLEVRAFSDSIVISTDLSSSCVAELFETVVNLQRIFIDRHVLVRGAIAFGKHFADSELIYSDALIKAYTEERDQARFPRILINKNLLDWFRNDFATDALIRDRIEPLFLTDRDDRVFLHYLNLSCLPAILTLLQTYNSQSMTATVLEKVQWLAEYHNFVAAKEGDHLLFDGAMIDGFRATKL